MSARPLRIAFSATYAGRAVGSGRYADALLDAWPALAPGDRVRRLTPRGPGALAKLRFEQWEAPRAARGADLLHVPYWAPPLRASLPVVVTVHDLIPLRLPDYRSGPRMAAYVRLVTRGTRGAAAVLADSRYTAGEVQRHLGIPPERIHTIPLGVDERFTPPAPEAIAELRARHGLPARFGLYLGGFDRRKNLVTLLAAWRRVWREARLPLVLAGRLPAPGADGLSPDPRAQARRLGLPGEALHAIGFVASDELPALYGAAELFAFPSRYEGFGLPPLEALACGTPTLVADATSLPEVVGDAALRVAPEEKDAWAAAVLTLLDDPALADRLRAAGPDRASRFRWAETARRTRDAYLAALGREGVGETSEDSP